MVGQIGRYQQIIGGGEDRKVAIGRQLQVRIGRSVQIGKQVQLCKQVQAGKQVQTVKQVYLGNQIQLGRYQKQIRKFLKNMGSGVLQESQKKNPRKATAQMTTASARPTYKTNNCDVLISIFRPSVTFCANSVLAAAMPDQWSMTPTRRQGRAERADCRVPMRPEMWRFVVKIILVVSDQCDQIRRYFASLAQISKRLWQFFKSFIQYLSIF